VYSVLHFDLNEISQ